MPINENMNRIFVMFAKNHLKRLIKEVVIFREFITERTRVVTVGKHMPPKKKLRPMR